MGPRNRPCREGTDDVKSPRHRASSGHDETLQQLGSELKRNPDFKGYKIGY